jgi:hypothetical protein
MNDGANVTQKASQPIDGFLQSRVLTSCSETLDFNRQIWGSGELQKFQIFADQSQKPNSKHSPEKCKTFSFVILMSVPLNFLTNDRTISARADDFTRADIRASSDPGKEIDLDRFFVEEKSHCPHSNGWPASLEKKECFSVDP